MHDYLRKTVTDDLSKRTTGRGKKLLLLFWLPDAHVNSYKGNE